MAVPIITSHSDFILYTSQLQKLDVSVDTEQLGSVSKSVSVVSL